MRFPEVGGERLLVQRARRHRDPLSLGEVGRLADAVERGQPGKGGLRDLEDDVAALDADEAEDLTADLADAAPPLIDVPRAGERRNEGGEPLRIVEAH
jgi:hypothetical protein